MTIKLVFHTDVFASPHAIHDHFVIGIRYSTGNTSEIKIIGNLWIIDSLHLAMSYIKLYFYYDTIVRLKMIIEYV